MSLPESDRPPSASHTGSEAFWREYTPGDTLPHPDRIGSYEIRKVLGEGSFGVVYEAEQLSPRRTVALKILRPGLATAKALRRFELEGEILGRLQHPGIAQIFEAGQSDFGYGPQPFLAMELVDGLTLLHYAAEHSLTISAKVKLLESICEAVHHAHQKGVVHRDLSPANVLVDRSGRPRIVDFGVARLVEVGNKKDPLRTQVGQFVGTLPYMSPEQAAGLPDEIDTRTDVYALGVLAYELLTGQQPLATEGLPITEVVRTIVDEQPQLAGALNHALRGDLETILAKALEKEKDRRYQSAGAMEADLGRFLRGEPIAARPASTLYLLSRLARRNRGLVAGVAAAFVFLSVGVVGTTLGMLRALRAEAGLRLEMAEAHRSRELTYVLLRDLSERGGTGRVQRPLLEDLLRQLKRRNHDNPGDLVVGTDLAQTLENLGKLEKKEGKYDIALPLQERALKIREELGVAFEDNLEVQKGISISYVMLGELCADRGEADGTRLWFTRALELDRSLVEAHPGDHRLRDNLCWSLERMGHLEARQGNSMGCEAFYRERHTLALELLETDPEHNKALFNLCSSHSSLFGRASSEGNWLQALEHALQKRLLAQELSENEPEHFLYARYLASAFRSLATAHEKLGHPRRAFLMYQEFVTRLAPLARRNPQDAVLMSQAGSSFVTLAYLALELDETETAAKACSALLDLGLQLSRLHPQLEGPRRLKAHAHRMYTIVQPGPSEDANYHARHACGLYRDLCASPSALSLDLLEFAGLPLELQTRDLRPAGGRRGAAASGDTGRPHGRDPRGSDAGVLGARRYRHGRRVSGTGGRAARGRK